MRCLIALLLLALGAAAPAAARPPRVLMMVPDDFMWPEYALPRALYQAAGLEVTVAAKLPGLVHPDRRNPAEYPGAGPVPVDLTFDAVDLARFDALTFVGGNGAWHDFFPVPRVHALLRTAMDRGMLVGLLCASTGLLGLADNFSGTRPPVALGRRVVGYYKVEGILRSLGKTIVVAGGEKEPAVAEDGNLVTGRNPESSRLFGETIARRLTGKVPELPVAVPAAGIPEGFESVLVPQGSVVIQEPGVVYVQPPPAHFHGSWYYPGDYGPPMRPWPRVRRPHPVPPAYTPPPPKPARPGNLAPPRVVPVPAAPPPPPPPPRTQTRPSPPEVSYLGLHAGHAAARLREAREAKAAAAAKAGKR